MDYTFTLVKGIPGGEGKEVTLTVTGQGEDKQELIKKGTAGRGGTSASGQETFSTTDVGGVRKNNQNSRKTWKSINYTTYFNTKKDRLVLFYFNFSCFTNSMYI